MAPMVPGTYDERMSEFRKVDQVAIAVENLEESSKLLEEVWGFELSEAEEVGSQGVRLRFADVGETRLEFMEALGTDSPIQKFIEKRGEGIQHIAFGVKDLEATLSRLKAKGVRLINETPTEGAGGSRVAFVHPKSFFGVLLELIEEA